MVKKGIFPKPVGQVGWFETACNKQHVFADPEAIEAGYDFVVIGGGFAGVNAAIRLSELRPGASIALIDALKIGMGDSGRNAGFMIDVPHVTVGDPKSDMQHHQWRLRLNKIVIDRMRRFKDEHGLQLDWQESGKHLAAREPRYVRSLHNLKRFLDAMGSPSRMLERDELKATLGTDYYIKSLYTPGTTLINPAEVVRGLASALPKTVQVFENTVVQRVEEGDVPVVHLVDGRLIRSSKVILTVSSFIRNFGVKRSDRMFGINSFGALTRVLSEDEVASLGHVQPWGCTAAHPAGTTVRYTTTKRLFVRNGLSFSTRYGSTAERLSKAHGKLRRAFDARFPTLKSVELEHVYAGMIPLSRNTQSLFGKVGNNLFAGAVGDGLGITRSSMLGLYLADMVCNVDSEEIRYLQATNNPSWAPPEPFRTIGAAVRLAFDEFRAAGEV